MKKEKSKDFNLPTNLANMTISELLHSSDAEIHVQPGKVSIRKNTDAGVATFQYDSYPSGRQTAVISSVPPRRRKIDYLDDIIQMYNSGMKQKDIAYQLGISPSYVCQILKKYRHLI